MRHYRPRLYRPTFWAEYAVLFVGLSRLHLVEPGYWLSFLATLGVVYSIEPKAVELGFLSVVFMPPLGFLFFALVGIAAQIVYVIARPLLRMLFRY
jgi:hypothetical protein